MRIAVTCENNTVFQHFGHTPEFAIFEVEDGKIIAETIISSGEEGHGALANVLAQSAVDVLVCGGIGGGAINALSEAGIQVIGGAEGNVKEVVEALIAGTLQVKKTVFVFGNVRSAVNTFIFVAERCRVRFCLPSL